MSTCFAAKLLAHYDANARTLPWRSPPGAPPPDPYRVWLSEIMLQQTTVAAAIPYFNTFITRWPSVAALAAADDTAVMAAWAGLGYYARARNLIKCARVVALEYGGVFPADEAALRALPGIGAYTAAAMAAIAFGARAVVVDGNVKRVMARVHAIETPLSQAEVQLHAHATAATPHGRPGDYAQALMDLGATLCTPRAPKCGQCPVARACKGRADPTRYPVHAPKAPRPERRETAWWIEVGGHVLLVERPTNGLLGGMRALPVGDAPPMIADWRGVDWQNMGNVRHIFTHFSLDLAVQRAMLLARPAPENFHAGLWWPVAKIETAGLPSLFAKAARCAMAAS
ncbi:MAG: A/G-specific adenine glycosylase [Alphaproteobacteria bacterium]|nr:A/G-specific adenine glycosylase [Alphaproteobacteria bacterium]MDE2041557.1 A/G-specific adenine glycosylase [Alphaproteobacteria bacterium]MDE2341717.1 A/G-specific adenine glycosylase [Alphaproteobacteria bacterium]